MANEMNFGEAVEALKNGERVSREGWNGKGMWLVMLHFNPAPDCDSLLHLNPPAPGHDGLTMQPCVGMKTAAPDGHMQPGWLASQADILANDWGVVS